MSQGDPLPCRWGRSRPRLPQGTRRLRGLPATAPPAAREGDAGGIVTRLDRELRRNSELEGERREDLRCELEARVRKEEQLAIKLKNHAGLEGD